MHNGRLVLVTGRDGLHGTVELPDEKSPPRGSSLCVTLADGRCVKVKSDTVHPDGAGGYLIDHSLNDFPHAPGPH